MGQSSAKRKNWRERDGNERATWRKRGENRIRASWRTWGQIGVEGWKWTKIVRGKAQKVRWRKGDRY